MTAFLSRVIWTHTSNEIKMLLKFNLLCMHSSEKGGGMNNRKGGKEGTGVLTLKFYSVCGEHNISEGKFIATTS